MVLLGTVAKDTLAEAWGLAVDVVSGRTNELVSGLRNIDWLSTGLDAFLSPGIITLQATLHSLDTYTVTAPLPASSMDALREFLAAHQSRRAFVWSFRAVGPDPFILPPEVSRWKQDMFDHAWASLRVSDTIQSGGWNWPANAPVSGNVNVSVAVTMFEAAKLTYAGGALSGSADREVDWLPAVGLGYFEPPFTATGAWPTTDALDEALAEVMQGTLLTVIPESTLNDIAALHQFANDLFTAAGTQEGTVRDAHGRVLVDLQTNTPVNPLPDPQFTFDSAFIRLAIAADAYAGGEVQIRLRNGGQIAPACGAMIGKDSKS